ncbi:MAG: non-ribosomal peptide synthetase [Pontibacterium sp.]
MTAQPKVTVKENPHRDVLRYPCSPTQHRFWVLDQLEPGDTSLNVAVRWRVEGDLEHFTLEKAFRLIVSRHEVLRTYFAQQDGEPVQVVEPEVPLSVPLIDLSHLSPEAAGQELARCAEREARRPFQLAVAPLLRVVRVQMDKANAVILLTAHHIVCDGWSVGLIASEMGEICDALQTGRSVNLPELSVSYGDYAAWMLDWLNTGELDDEQQYWSAQLHNANYFELPVDHARPPVWQNDSAIASTLLPRELTDSLSRLAADNGCTLYMVAMATLVTLLHRYSGETDISLGTQVAGRSEEEIEPLIGVFINTLVLRHDLSENPAFSELLSRVRSVVSGAFDHEYMPIEKLIERLKPKRDTSRNPLFSVNFIFQRSFVENKNYHHFCLVDLPSTSAGALYDLNFFMVERPEGWRFSCEYNRGLFEGETVERFLGHLENLFKAVTAQPGQRLSEFPLLAQAEQQLLLSRYNQTKRHYPSDQTFIELFAEQANRTPDAVAVVCGNQSLTYQALARDSDQLASALVQRGWAPQARVGVFLNRSSELVVALLAVLKSGSAYVPLDPHYPRDRLAHVAADARMAGIVSHSALSDLLADINVDCLSIDTDVVTDGQRVPLPVPSPEDTAYVIYTSGSTGLPKGVQVHHRALVNFLCSMRTEPGLKAEDRLLAVTTISFDIAALEIYLPLIVGAQVVLAREEDVVDGNLLDELLERHQISVLQATPVTWRLLLDAGWQPHKRLKMLCGGEALPRNLADRLLQQDAELWNLYGPTETTIWSAALKVSAGEGPVPVGLPIANTQFYILDAQGQPNPAGVPGELYIGGDGVAQGYFERPDLTPERFIPDPYSETAGARLYRTGDRVRQRPNGHLEFLGRTDFQVKLRGYRIELGEIDAVLQSHSGVKDAVTILGQRHGGEPALRAYIVAHTEQDDLQAALRQRLAERLPAYMHPSSLTLLPALPQTPNGKTDRKALPAPVMEKQAITSEPLDEAETALAEIWRELIDWQGVINPGSNFFELGGHSITAARLLARIEQETGRHITLAQLFHNPTLRGLAELMRPRSQYEDDFRQVVRLQSHGAQPPLIALHNTGTYFSVSKQLGKDYPFISLQLFDPDYPTDKLPDTLEEVAAGYVDLIRQVQPTGPYQLVGWCLVGVLSFEVARQLRLAGEEVSLVILDGWIPGYTARMPWLKRKIVSTYYRALVVSGVCKQMIQGEIKIAQWLNNRLTIKRNKSRQRALLQTTDNKQKQTETLAERPEAMERYGQWLFAYLDGLISRYEIKHYPGEILVMRSAREPRSKFLYWDMGWGLYADKVRVEVIEGDHWTMLRDPGADQIAGHLAAMLSGDKGNKT